ncbi:hypothetical protein GGF50DRAFT_125244 [Schizophyllum commune]
MAADLYGYCEGPMPIEDFLHEFVPQNSTPETPEYTYIVKEDSKEADLYPILLGGAKAMMHKHRFLDTSNNPDQLAKPGEKLKPDAMAYDVDEGTYMGVTLEDVQDGKVTQFRKNVFGAEGKREKDIFNDMAKPGRFEPRVRTRNSESEGQVLRYIEEIHTHQPRCFSFFLFFTKHYFRLIRTDRDGLIVTERTAWTGQRFPNRLNDFFYRFDHLSREEQGFDTSVRESNNAEEEDAARKALMPYIPEETQITEPIRQIGVPVQHGAPAKGMRYYYIWAPTVQQRGLRARATRGYPAWDSEEKKIVWIKDSWRSANDMVTPESVVIKELNDANVEFAPTLFCGGDLPGPTQKTRTHEFVNAFWNRGQRKPHHPRIHHRLAETFGRPLWEFESSQHLLEIMHDAFTCHRMAVSKCRKLHRDFSAWNILYDPKSKRGILTDWDLCAPMPSAEACEEDPTINPLAQVPNSSGRPDRTGTWMFMSIKVQDADPHLHTVQDDLEALFWVGVYMIILYMPIPRANAIAIVDDVFLLPDTVSPALVSWVKSYNQLIFDWVSYLNKLERHSLDPLLDDAPPAPTDLVDYDKLDQIWRRILDQGVFEPHDRLNDRDHKRDPFHVTAVYRKSVAKEADRQVELQASARFTLAESQRAEAEARRAEMQRGNPKASIEFGLSQNSGADASHSNTLLERSAAMDEGGEGVEGGEGAIEEQAEEEDKEASGLRSPSRSASLPAGEDAGMGWNSWEETDAADETREQEAGRAAKRQRTTSAGAFRRTSPPSPDRPGTTSPRSRKNSKLE